MAKSIPNLQRYERKAAQLLGRPLELLRLAVRARDKLSDTKANTGSKDNFTAIKEDLLLMMDLVKAWAKGEYKGVANSSVIGMAAALLYFVTPLDAIPDFVLGFGFVDDIAVLGYVLGKLRHELDGFVAWRATGQLTHE